MSMIIQFNENFDEETKNKTTFSNEIKITQENYNDNKSRK